MEKVSCLLTVYYLYPVVRNKRIDLYWLYMFCWLCLHIIEIEQFTWYHFYLTLFVTVQTQFIHCGFPNKTWHKWPTICWGCELQLSSVHIYADRLSRKDLFRRMLNRVLISRHIVFIGKKLKTSSIIWSYLHSRTPTKKTVA